ncbi:MAG: ABC transporter ATP-binding protein [Burkholderiales bacterium]|nr:ABC transporter ATP-binding protein [Burkholderiales bacterium]
MNESSTQADLCTQDESAAAVEAVHISMRYGPVTVLDDVSFTLVPGSVLGLVGGNGAGKTTLLRCLLGLTPPTVGASRLYGCDSRDLTDPVRTRLGYVAQRPELYDWLRVREQLALFGQLYPGWTAAHARELSLRLDLPDDVRVGNLSPGERQRLAIVLAMQHRPDLLIFDEPVSSLDPVGRRDFLRLLFEHDTLHHAAATAIISSHLLDDLERVVTHLLFLQQGRVQLFGGRDELADCVREFDSGAALERVPGVLRSRRRADGSWQNVLDLRVLDPAVLPPTADLRALSLVDLYLALNG